jgi:hypothetical protein
MLEKINHSFWDSYAKADELERHDLLETLPLFKGMDKKSHTVKTVLSATLLQSYFDDLIEYIGTVNEENAVK